MGMMAAMNPKKVKDIRLLANALEDWEVRVKNLKVEHDIELPEQVLVAVMTGMLPNDLQDLVFQWTDGKVSFTDLRDKVVLVAQNRATAARPAPMEVDKVSTCGKSCWTSDGRPRA